MKSEIFKRITPEFNTGDIAPRLRIIYTLRTNKIKPEVSRTHGYKTVRVKELSGNQFYMDIHLKETGKITVAELSGEIDGKSGAVVQEKILPLVKDNCRLVLDFSRVTSMSGNGLRFLLTLRRQVPYSGNLVLSGLPEQIKDSMAITGFLDLFTIFPTQLEAVRFLS